MHVKVHNPPGRPAPTSGPLGIRRGSAAEENPCSTCGKGVPPTPTAHMNSQGRRAWALQQVGRPWVTNPADEEETGCIEALHGTSIPGVTCRVVASPLAPGQAAGPTQIVCCAEPGVFFMRGGSSCPDSAYPVGSFIDAHKSAVLVCRRGLPPPLPPPGAPPLLTPGRMLGTRRGQRAFKHRLATAGAVANPERVRNCNLGALALAMSATDPQGYQHWARTRLYPQLAREQNPGVGALLLALRASDPFGYYRQAPQPNPAPIPIGNQMVPWAATRTGPGAGNYSWAMSAPGGGGFPMLNNLAPQGPPWVFNPGAAQLAYAYQPYSSPGWPPPPPPPQPLPQPPQAQVLGVGPMSSVPLGARHNPTFWPGGPRGNPVRDAYWRSR